MSIQRNIDAQFLTTIPNVQPSVPTVRLSSEVDWRRGVLVVLVDGGRTFGRHTVTHPLPMELVQPKRVEARREVDRQCKGQRRRQERRGR